jgi:hypothetical protein
MEPENGNVKSLSNSRLYCYSIRLGSWICWCSQRAFRNGIDECRRFANLMEACDYEVWVIARIREFTIRKEAKNNSL